jgi:hypothetical protein
MFSNIHDYSGESKKHHNVTGDLASPILVLLKSQVSQTFIKKG